MKYAMVEGVRPYKNSIILVDGPLALETRSVAELKESFEFRVPKIVTKCYCDEDYGVDISVKPPRTITYKAVCIGIGGTFGFYSVSGDPYNFLTNSTTIFTYMGLPRAIRLQYPKASFLPAVNKIERGKKYYLFIDGPKHMDIVEQECFPPYKGVFLPRIRLLTVKRRPIPIIAEADERPTLNPSDYIFDYYLLAYSPDRSLALYSPYFKPEDFLSKLYCRQTNLDAEQLVYTCQDLRAYQ